MTLSILALAQLSQKEASEYNIAHLRSYVVGRAPFQDYQKLMRE